MKWFSFFVGLGCSLLTLIVLGTLGKETSIEVYTPSLFTNFLEIFLILEIGVISTEALLDSTAREVALDTIVVIGIAAATTYIYNEYQVIIFYSNYLTKEAAERLVIPDALAVLFACFGRTKVSSWLSGSGKKED